MHRLRSLFALFAFVVDAEGNHIELIQPARR